VSISYFIAYSCELKTGMNSISGSSKLGRCNIQSEKPITSIDQITQIEQALMKQFGLKWCIVTNWRRFEEEAEQASL
jgi:hypothetical protein